MSTRPPATTSWRRSGGSTQRRPTGPAEDVAYRKLRSLASGEPDGYITPDDLPKFGTDVADFDKALERHVVDKGWFKEAPSKVVDALGGPRRPRDRRRRGRARSSGSTIPISGLVLIGGATIAGGIVVTIFAGVHAGGDDGRRR